MGFSTTIPYPRPDYTDPELDAKEMVNGTIIKGLFDDLSHFRPAFSRYNIDQDKLIDSTVESGKRTRPENLDIGITDPGMGGVKEKAWLPFTIEPEEPGPEKVYDPRWYYNDASYVPYGREALGINYVDGVFCDIPYYDIDNAGLFGFRTEKDGDGNVTGRWVMFYSLKRGDLTELAKVPDGLDFGSRSWGGYVKGGLLLRFTNGGSWTYCLFRLDGVRVDLIERGDDHVSFGDDGAFAITTGDTTEVFDSSGSLINTIDAPACKGSLTSASGYSPVIFGTKIGKEFYYVKDDSSSWKWSRVVKGKRSDGTPIYEWSAKEISTPVWKMKKRLLWDYSRDNWLEKPFKRLHYNLRKNGVFMRAAIPATPDTIQNYQFQGSDIYGDFIFERRENGNRLLHTYDFSVWSEVSSSEAVDRFYRTQGRIWVRGRSDNVVGFLPITMQVESKGGDTMALTFNGFVFRRV